MYKTNTSYIGDNKILTVETLKFDATFSRNEEKPDLHQQPEHGACRADRPN
jgi:hypothetical protein